MVRLVTPDIGASTIGGQIWCGPIDNGLTRRDIPPYSAHTAETPPQRPKGVFWLRLMGYKNELYLSSNSRIMGILMLIDAKPFVGKVHAFEKIQVDGKTSYRLSIYNEKNDTGKTYVIDGDACEKTPQDKFSIYNMAEIAKITGKDLSATKKTGLSIEVIDHEPFVSRDHGKSWESLRSLQIESVAGKPTFEAGRTLTITPPESQGKAPLSFLYPQVANGNPDIKEKLLTAFKSTPPYIELTFPVDAKFVVKTKSYQEKSTQTEALPATHTAPTTDTSFTGKVFAVDPFLGCVGILREDGSRIFRSAVYGDLSFAPLAFRAQAHGHPVTFDTHKGEEIFIKEDSNVLKLRNGLYDTLGNDSFDGTIVATQHWPESDISYFIHKEATSGDERLYEFVDSDAVDLINTLYVTEQNRGKARITEENGVVTVEAVPKGLIEQAAPEILA